MLLQTGDDFRQLSCVGLLGGKLFYLTCAGAGLTASDHAAAPACTPGIQHIVNNRTAFASSSELYLPDGKTNSRSWNGV